ISPRNVKTLWVAHPADRVTSRTHTTARSHAISLRIPHSAADEMIGHDASIRGTMATPSGRRPTDGTARRCPRGIRATGLDRAAAITHHSGFLGLGLR